jgi:group I intron endonuclease
MITYLATNTLNGKFYIGSTTNFERRKRTHLTGEAKYPFQRALQKNPDLFSWEIIQDDSDEPVLEQALLDMWFGKELCYNLNPNASRPPGFGGIDHPMFGKTGELAPMFGRTGEKCPMFGKTGDKHNRYGKKHTEDSKQKNRVAHMGEKNPMYGKTGDKHHNFGKTGDKHHSFGKKWWVNEEGETKFQRDNPGPDWRPGMKWR